MKAVLAILWILSVAGAFALGRLGASDGAAPGFATVDSFRDALAERDELSRSYRMSAFLEGLGPQELPAALEVLEQNSIAVTREEARLFLLAWSRFDAPGAFAWARAWPTQWSDTLMEEAIYAWGLRDPRAALRELEAVEAPEQKVRLRRSLLEGWLHSQDRTGASEYIAAIPEARQRSRLAFLLAAETMRDGAEAVMRWAEAVPEDAPNDFKRGAFYHASAVLAREDPRRAAQWFEAHRTLPYSTGSLDVIARRWAEYHDPPALFEWLRSLPSEGERASEIGEAVAATFGIWLGKAPEEAEAWLSSRTPDPELDSAVAELVRSLSQASPASAIAWAARIQDETQRRRSTLLAGRAWRRQDPEALRAWLAQSDLPEAARQSILRAPPGVAGRRAAARPAAPLSPR